MSVFHERDTPPSLGKPVSLAQIYETNDGHDARWAISRVRPPLRRSGPA